MSSKAITQNSKWTKGDFIPGNGTSTIDTVQADEVLGVKIREIRNKREWTLKTLEEKSKVNINTLCMIENGKTSPSVYTLQRLARAFDVSIVDFFETVEISKPIIFTAHDHRPQADCCQALIHNLGKGLNNCPLEPFIVTMEKNANSGGRTLIHSGFEFVYCLSGKIIYFIQDIDYPMTAGDSILFSAFLGHRWENNNDGESQLLLVLTPTGHHQEQAPSHFHDSVKAKIT
jgi:transcriptional regulator with XRE-family HTH domain